MTMKDLPSPAPNSNHILLLGLLCVCVCVCVCVWALRAHGYIHRQRHLYISKQSFAQWQYHSQWVLSELWLLLIENFSQNTFSALSPFNHKWWYTTSIVLYFAFFLRETSVSVHWKPSHFFESTITLLCVRQQRVLSNLEGFANLGGENAVSVQSQVVYVCLTI